MSKFIFKVILLLFLTISYSNSNEKVAYIDLDFLFNNSIEGKKIILKLEELKKISIEKIKSKEENLIKLEKDLNQKKIYLAKKNLKRN